MENEQEAFRIFAVLTNWYTLMRYLHARCEIDSIEGCSIYRNSTQTKGKFEKI